MARRSTARPAPRRTARTRREMQAKDHIPEVYQEMLEEAEARDPAQFDSDRPVKRRRLEGSNGIPTRAIPIDTSQPAKTESSRAPEPKSAQIQQVVYDSTTSDESDIEWEDVDVEQHTPNLYVNKTADEGRDDTLQITLERQPEFQKKAIIRRKPVTAAEKKLRLDAHKAHLLCLLAHVQLRNRWCNDDNLQSHLKKMLPRKIIALLNPDETKPQFARSTTFIDGLNQAGDVFSRKFRVTKMGLRRAHWAEDPTQLKQKMESIMSTTDIFFSKEEFMSQAKLLQGSRDFGAQLFCALLRSAAVETRLVCSLQPLPFSGTVKDMTPAKKPKQYIVLSSDDHETSNDERKERSKPSTTPSRIRRIGRPDFHSHPTPVTSVRETTPRESPHPVFWVEAFNEAVQKWIPVDPLVTKSLAKPSKFEPPASDMYNGMAYVVAFEDDASARDVTRRYAKAFNAKTRKTRVEYTRNGDEWWKGALAAYEKPFLEDRDEAEISELTAKSGAEPMPRNIQDFKDHPVYALERHLRRNEVIHPKRVIGHVGLSKAGSKSDGLETVYRRSDVHIVRSADKWYRLGRDVKVGEQPLKHVPANKQKSGFASDEEEEDENQETPLYAEYQTEIYRPPPVVNGRIPKNNYGNLDVYVPSMIPPGAVHVKHPDAARAARILGIDYADAVTGFEFRGRRGTAVFGGIVVAKENYEALEETVNGIADERRQAAMHARSEESLRLWRLFLTKLRIAERVKAYASEDEDMEFPPEAIDSGTEGDASEESETGQLPEQAGGFFTGMCDSPGESLAGGFVPDGDDSSNDHEAGGFIPDEPDDDSLAGGFIPEATALPDGQQVGGFVPKTIDEKEKITSLEAPVIQSSVTKPHASITTEKVTSFHGSKKAKRSKPPHYELIVVPSHNRVPVPSQNDIKLPERGLEGSSAILPITVDSSTLGDSKPASLGTTSRPPSPENQDPAPLKAAPESDSELEKGSLLSEDPEDEDAIPEWLV
ncbi:hypothetical protein POX_a01142 [Penicillium oxalicum]|uniref:hypothetical protein n=1 Tax=Penicillium oxalicum TaxID=69781 RepID=UPI0020B67B34|nr:hypothetical protein POX_a01142 [Penicillium oxalicum]KAI2794543.1 hypothetical protein POX_a01142 [Penicillium oxalicum]